ncbi:MAG: Fur family transcriptional regulator [Wolinella sp.]
MEKDQIHTLFQRKGIRNSAIKSKIIEILSAEPHPLSANELHKKVSVDSPTDLASIYRNLNVFKERGIVKEAFRTSLESYFELAMGEPLHPHFWCQECKKVFCLSPLSLEETLWLSSLYEKGRVRGITLNIEGICETCHAKDVK